MNFFVSILAGLALGAAASLAVAFYGKRCLQQRDAQALARYKRTSNLVGVAALLLAFVLCRFLPLRTEAMLIGTVITLPILNVFLMVRAVNQIQSQENKTETEE